MRMIAGDWLIPDEGTRELPAPPKLMDPAIELCMRHDVAVCAPGGFGFWPWYLAQRFKSVFTFEPDVRYFEALCRNLESTSICRLQAFAGYDHALVKGTPTLSIDDLGLDTCDFLQINTGDDAAALMGAELTVSAYRPVILASRAPDVVDWLEKRTYKPEKQTEAGMIYLYARGRTTGL